MNRIDLADRSAVITGGASGIGLATAKRVIESGAAVVLWDQDGDALAQARSSLGEAVRGVAVVDISDPDAVELAVKETNEAVGVTQIVVNSAGIGGGGNNVWEYDIETWNRMIAINLTGQFLVCRALLPQMIESGWGRIVNVASVAGKEGNPKACAYSAAKAGLIGFTKSLAKELAHTRVLVNVVTPAIIDTPLLKHVPRDRIDYMLSKVPMGRMGTAGEIAAMITWLCSEDCSFSTGAVFDLSGGRATY